jgi:hypothetical protein
MFTIDTPDIHLWQRSPEVTDLNERRRRRKVFVVQIPDQELSPASVLQMAKQLPISESGFIGL